MGGCPSPLASRRRRPEQDVTHRRGVPPHAALSSRHLVPVQAFGDRSQGLTARTPTPDPPNHRLRHERRSTERPLGHASIQTTGDIYTDWDIAQLAETMLDVLAEDAE